MGSSRPVFGVVGVPVTIVTPPDAGLVSISGLSYVGGFRTPAYAGPDADTLAYNGPAMALNPSGDGGNGSLYLYGFDNTFKVAEVDIPTAVNSATVGDLNTATSLQDPINLDNSITGNLGDVAIANAKRIGGLMVYGGELWINFYCFYDGSNDALRSLAKGPLTMVTASVTGPYAFTRNGTWAVASTHASCRYLGHIPTAWQSSFGNVPCLAGGSTGFSSIASAQSNGPALTVFDPGTLSANAVSARQVLAYPVGEPLRQSDIQSTEWNFTSSPAGVVWPTGTRSVLFFGTHGIGAYSYPPEAPPYKQYVWAYDANDLQAVYDGTANAQDVEPYGIWDITDKFPAYSVGKWCISGAVINQTTNRIYVYCRQQDTSNRPLVHVFDVV